MLTSPLQDAIEARRKREIQQRYNESQRVSRLPKLPTDEQLEQGQKNIEQKKIRQEVAEILPENEATASPKPKETTSQRADRLTGQGRRLVRRKRLPTMAEKYPNLTSEYFKVDNPLEGLG